MLTYNFVTGANTSAVTSANAFNLNQVLQTVWSGVKWSVPGEWLHCPLRTVFDTDLLFG